METPLFQNVADTNLPVRKGQKDALFGGSKSSPNADQSAKGRFLELVAEMLNSGPEGESPLQASVEKIRQWLEKKDLQAFLTETLASMKVPQDTGKEVSEQVVSQDLLALLIHAQKAMELDPNILSASSDPNKTSASSLLDEASSQTADGKVEVEPENMPKRGIAHRMKLNSDAFFIDACDSLNPQYIDDQATKEAVQSTKRLETHPQAHGEKAHQNTVKEVLAGSTKQQMQIIDSAGKQETPIQPDLKAEGRKEALKSGSGSGHLQPNSDHKSNSMYAKMDGVVSKIEESEPPASTTETKPLSEKRDPEVKSISPSDKATLETSGEKVQKLDFQASHEPHEVASQTNHIKAGEPALNVKPPSSPQPVPQNDIIHQIVEKIQFKNVNEQSEIKITLKPEFLGSIRLNIAAEDHQVSIKVLAESPVIKHILESNLHQLKTEFSNNGLEISKFDVYVGADSQHFGRRENSGRYSNTKSQRKMQAVFRLDGSVKSDDQVQGAARNSNVNLDRIDYYV